MKPSVILYKTLPDDLLQRLEEHFSVTQVKNLRPETVSQHAEAFAQAEGLLGSSEKVDAALLEKMPKLRATSTVSVGYDNFDVEALNARRVLLMHTPTVLTETVADTVMALVLSTARRVVEVAERVKAGEWTKSIGPDWFGCDVHHKTLGIVGMGRIGMALAQRAHFGFGMPILYNARRQHPQAEERFNARYCDLDTLLQEADFVCLILPLSEETHHLFGQAQFAKMKSSAIFINAGRGPVVDEQALIAALVEKDDRIVADRLSHASLLEAASLSPAQLRRFTHNDPQQLAQLLAKPLAGEQLAVTEGIFSMDGDSAPLAAIHAATQAAGAVLLVDDAHGVGVVGDEGRGSCAAQAVRPELLVVTFGKAFGVSGAAVLCDEAMADYLLQFARHLIYSTAMPPAQAVALSAALGIIRSDEGQQRRDILAARIRQFREGMGEVSLGLTDSVSAIQPLIVGDNARALNLACRLRDAGCWATAIRPPTVPVGSARLRLTLTAAHHAEDINRLLEVLHGHSE